MTTDRLMALSCKHCRNFYLLLLSESIYHMYSIAYKYSENFWQIVPYTWGKLKPNEAFEPPPKTTARTIEFRGVLLPDFTQAPGLTRRISVQKVLYTVLCCKRWHSQKAAINTGCSAVWQQPTLGNRNIHSTEPWEVTPGRSPEGSEDGPAAEQCEFHLQWNCFRMSHFSPAVSQE